MEFTSFPNPDFLPKNQIKSLQLDLLNQHLEYLRIHSPFYQKKLKDFPISPLKDLSEIASLPRTSKTELAQFNPEFYGVPTSKIVEYVTTSGSTGKAVTMPLTKNDLARMAYNETRALGIAGITAEDTVQITATLDKCFIAGMAYYQGLTEIGAKAIRAGMGSLDFHLEMIRQFRPTALIGVPSFLFKIAQFAPNELNSVKKIIGIGEPLRTKNLQNNHLSNQLQSVWEGSLFSTYASTEMSTAFTECSEHRGGHVLPELVYVEILDENGQEVPDGELGEVTATPFGIEGMPLLRFQTGDLARKHTTTCGCGRKTIRLGPIEGRLAHMIKFKGTTIFPNQLEEVLHSFAATSPYLIVLKSDENGLDQVEIQVPFSLLPSQLEELGRALQAKLRVKPTLIPKPEGEIQSLLFRDHSRKPKKILDLRNH